MNPEIAEQFVNGYDDEEDLVQGIKEHLLNEDERKFLFDRRLDVTDVLNGRFHGDLWPEMQKIFDRWNKLIGAKAFGF